MKKTLALLLCALLLLTPALADEALSMLPAVLDYAGANYTDVPADSWYAQAAQVCYETGLMTGTQRGFEPELTLSGSQLAAIAARLREAIVGDTIPDPDPGQPWYAHYVRYLEDWGISVPAPEEPASRLAFAQLLSAVIPDSYLSAVNTVTTLPDCDDAQVLRLYAAGILTGSDEYGTFNPQGTLRRHECATMTARVVRPDLRRQFTLKLPESQRQPVSYEEEFLQTEALRVNGHSIPFSTYLDTLNSIVFRTDFAMAADGGERIHWDAKYEGIDDLGAYFKDQATSQVIQDYLISSRAAALGCSVDDLPQVLTPDPAADLDKIYCAKHILLDSEQAAIGVLAQLYASPSLETFDTLMAQYSTDPGSKSQPNGYLFTDGEMVSEFENAVKALDFYSCSTAPVKSQFGWHIILRLDPTAYPNWQTTYQESQYERIVNSWLTSCTVTPNTVELDKLDVRSQYAKYLEELGM